VSTPFCVDPIRRSVQLPGRSPVRRWIPLGIAAAGPGFDIYVSPSLRFHLVSFVVSTPFRRSVRSPHRFPVGRWIALRTAAAGPGFVIYAPPSRRFHLVSLVVSTPFWVDPICHSVRSPDGFPVRRWCTAAAGSGSGFVINVHLVRFVVSTTFVFNPIRCSVQSPDGSLDGR